jgi:hypothetical protein
MEREGLIRRNKNRLLVAGAATAVLTGGGVAFGPTAGAETQARSTTSISQKDNDDTKVTRTGSGTITERNRHVVNVNRADYSITIIDNDKVKVIGKGDQYSNKSIYAARDGVEELIKQGLVIKKVHEKDYGEKLEVDVENMHNLDRAKRDDKILKEKGHVVRVNNGEYTVVKVNEGTINVVGKSEPYSFRVDGGPVIGYSDYGIDRAQDGVDELIRQGLLIKKVSNIKDSRIDLKIRVDHAYKLDRLIKNDVVLKEGKDVVRIKGKNYTLARVDHNTINVVGKDRDGYLAKSGADELDIQGLNVKKVREIDHNSWRLKVDVVDASMLNYLSLEDK